MKRQYRELHSCHNMSAPPLVNADDTLQENHEEILQQMLPANYEHKILSVDELQPYHKDDHIDQRGMFTAVVRINLRSKEEASQWLEDFKKLSFTDWRCRRCFQENTKRILFKKGYRCHHDTIPAKPHTKPHKKHTNCRAFLYITIKNPATDRSKSKDKFLKDFPCEVSLHHCHNHPIKSTDILRHRKPTPEVERLFLAMYQKGHTPSSALAAHKFDLKLKYPENWSEHLADGSECPNLQWCYHVHRKKFLKESEAPLGSEVMQPLVTAIEKYNTECGSVCASVESLNEWSCDLTVVICSPLMKRVHQLLSTSGDITFLISEGAMNRHNARIFTFLAPSVAGALPLGIIFTSSKSQPVLSHGLKMLQSVMPSDAFSGRGPSQGPQIMMTDDVSQEREALSTSFPGVILLYRLFHILQAFWQFVWDSKHNIDAKDKQEIYFLFQKWCYAESENEFDRQYRDILCNVKVSQYPALVNEVKSLFEKAGEWAPCYQSDLSRANNTGDYSERTILWYKNEILERVHSYNLILLFEFLSTKLDAYFEQQIASVLNDKEENYWSSKNYKDPSFETKIKSLLCSKTSHEDTYLVKNAQKGDEYIVNMHVQICSCQFGKNGTACKHQLAVAQQFGLSTLQPMQSADVESKAILHQIMTSIPAAIVWHSEYVPLTSDQDLDSEVVISCEEVILESVHPEVGSSSQDFKIYEIDNSTDAAVQNILTSSSEADLLKDPVEARQLWQSVNDYIVTGLQQMPDIFAGPVLNFAREFMKAKECSESAALTALHNFTTDLFENEEVEPQL